MNIKPIKTEQDYDNTLQRIDVLFEAQPNTQEFDELEILTTLVENYENKYYQINISDPIEAIKFRMEQKSLKQKDLIPIIGTKSRVSEILNKKRKLTLQMIRNLNNNLKIPFDSLFMDYKLKLF